jgi:DNA-binding MarR family transcriptional regulator
MITGALDPLIHDPGRLRIVASLAALPARDAIRVSRLREISGLTSGSLATGLHELGHAGYVRAERPGGGDTPVCVALTGEGRAALDHYTATLRRLPRPAREAPAPCLRVSDAERDAATAALGEHFAHGRLTLDELGVRLEAALTATTHGELSLATWDLPDLT